MTKPREKTREELTAEIEDGKKKIRQFENREKDVASQKLSKEERRTRSHRLIVRARRLLWKALCRKLIAHDRTRKPTALLTACLDE